VLNLPVARVVAPLPLPAGPPVWPRLADFLRDQDVGASLGTLAGLVRPAIFDKPFNVGPVSGSVTPTFYAQADPPGREEIGLLGPVTVRLSMQRLVSVTIMADASTLLAEQISVGGLKKPGGWTPFDSQVRVTITNPSANFYVVGQVYAPLWYVKRVMFDALREELRALLPSPNAEATGVV